MELLITGNKKSKEAKDALKLMGNLVSYAFENDGVLKQSEKEQLQDCVEILKGIYQRTN